MVQNFINSENKLFCDDCLSEKLDIKPRQHINQICNKLKKQVFYKERLNNVLLAPKINLSII